LDVEGTFCAPGINTDQQFEFLPAYVPLNIQQVLYRLHKIMQTLMTSKLSNRLSLRQFNLMI